MVGNIAKKMSGSGEEHAPNPPVTVPKNRNRNRNNLVRSASAVQPHNHSNSSANEAVNTSRKAHYLIPDEWHWMAGVVSAAIGLDLFFDSDIANVGEMIALALSVVLLAANRYFVKVERQNKEKIGLRFCLMLAVVALPMLLFGYTVAACAKNHLSTHWMIVVAIQITVGVVASVILSGRLPSVIAAHVSLWTALAFFSGSLASIGFLGIAVIGGIFLSKRHVRLEEIATAKRLELALRQNQAEELLAEYEESGQGWFWVTDRRGALTYLSPIIGDVLQQDVNELIGKPIKQLFIRSTDNSESERTLSFHLSARSSFQDIAVRAAVPGEDERWWSITGRPIHDNYNNFIGFRGSGIDLTEKRKSQESATRLAHYDSLTSLANRFQMSQTLEKILGAQRVEHRACSVFLLDLDRFKQVNDSMGHPAGDALLMQVAQRLERTVDKAGRVGRLGGDEFQIIIPGQHPVEQLAFLAQRIIETVSQPYSIEGQSVIIGVSVGIAMCPQHGLTSDTIIRNADLALYAAKDGGRGRHHFYNADLHTDAEERRQLEQELRDALVTGGLELHYQPVIKTTTEKITGFEALLRWTHPKLGPLSPAKFIPIAEETGLIVQIGEWALRKACEDMARWPETVRVAVNVSPLQFANPALPSIVTSALAAAQVHPDRLELEITESVFLNDDANTDAMFAALKRVGVRLALDDFGTGYSSLGYLKKAPFDKIKIDQSFVRGATMKGSRNGAIIASIVSLAEALGMETTAEGVETLDELDLIRMLGCSHIQGYIYERPLHSKAASARLESGLIAIAKGPRSARQRRQTMLRKVVLDCAGEQYAGTIRNISSSGVMVEGLWNVPPGTVFTIHLDARQFVVGVARWSQDDRMGIEFASELALDERGRFVSQAQTQLRGMQEDFAMRKSA